MHEFGPMDESGAAFWIVRIGASIVGALLIYAAVFTYPQEREGLHSTLEDWWLRLDETSDAAMKLHVAFIRKTAATAKRGFDWLFGPALSTRFIVASGFLSMGSFAIGMLSFGDYGWAVPTGLALFSVGILVLALLIGRSQDRLMKEIEESTLKYDEDLAGLRNPRSHGKLLAETRLPLGQKLADWPDLQSSLLTDYALTEKKSWWEDLLSPDKSSDIILPVVFATLAFSSTGLVFAGAREKGVDEGVFMIALLTSFVCDLVCVLITVYFLEKISKATGAVIAAAYFLVDALVAAVMLLGPWVLFIWVAEPDSTIAHYLIFVAAANISTAAPSVVFLLVALTALLHRIFWPLVLRPFYNLIHADKITKPKTMGFAGLACFSVWLDLPEGYQSIFKSLLNML